MGLRGGRREDLPASVPGVCSSVSTASNPLSSWRRECVSHIEDNRHSYDPRLCGNTEHQQPLLKPGLGVEWAFFNRKGKQSPIRRTLNLERRDGSVTSDPSVPDKALFRIVSRKFKKKKKLGNYIFSRKGCSGAPGDFTINSSDLYFQACYLWRQSSSVSEPLFACVGFSSCYLVTMTLSTFTIC